MKVLTDLEMLAQVVLGNELADFPVSPKNGELAFVDGVLHIWATIGGEQTWYPLTNKALHYTHTQGTAATSWSINHGLNSTALAFFVYDDNDDVQLADIDFVDGDNCTITLTEDTAGRCVLFASSDTYAGTVQNPLDGNFEQTGDIVPEVTDTVNLGSATNQYDTVYATNFEGQASSASYADLAEKYTCGSELPEGTLLTIADASTEYEVEESTAANDSDIIGVVSKKPAFLMNKDSKGVAACLTGKVPVRVVGPVQKGKMLVASETPGCARQFEKGEFGKIGYALETTEDEGESLIMAMIKCA